MRALDSLRPLILMLSGFLGASGVVLAAAASHGGDAHLLGNASTMCLAHAPVLLALCLGHGMVRTATLAALVLSLGTVLFAADLVVRHLGSAGLFPMAAPSGGLLMILGWLIVAAGAFFRTKSE
ncbi:DUF423 domain-containing protein [Rhizobium straminoryzae]|uniref:DUF423 domain-containing protein n=1 Tax=Rhizobium straminoryzae TaxID=1387186 RepID=A0A549T5E8_9HYPH|nr:DUF423 domain-containing protein [Rhizobium straminoryzae]TRL37101.1 DUF423 domain-containing protein [Rhizobium straminoryzae]